MTAPPLPPSFEPAHLAHIRRNVKTLQQRGAPADVIAEYLQDEGISPRELYAAPAPDRGTPTRSTPPLAAPATLDPEQILHMRE